MARIAIYRIVLLGAVTLLIGCAPPVVKVDDTSLCPGKSYIAEAVDAVTQIQANLKPLKASGKAVISWVDEKQKKRSETCDVRIRFYGPNKLFFYGSTILGEAILLGTNEDQFWLRFKPKEISSFYSGKRELADRCGSNSWMNPANILDALGVINVDETWELTSEAGRDVLTKSDGSRLLKKVYINPCDYRFQRIEYFDTAGQVVLTTTLGDYNDADGLRYPRRITIQSSGPDALGIDITLRSIRPYLPTEKELNGKGFRLPSDSGIDHVYELGDDCKFIEK
jgi:hypothetical protein